MCDPVTIGVMALSYAQNEQEIKKAEQAEADRAARDLQFQETEIEKATMSLKRQYGDSQTRESQEQQQIGEQIASIESQQLQDLATARVNTQARGVAGTQAASNLSQILTSKGSMAILAKEEEGERLAESKISEREDAKRTTQDRYGAVMAIPEQKMSGSDKNFSRFMSLAQGYMTGQMLGGAGAGAGAGATGASPTAIPAGATGSSALTTTTAGGMTSITPPVNPLVTTPNLGIATTPTMAPTTFTPSWYDPSRLWYTQPSSLLSIGY